MSRRNIVFVTDRGSNIIAALSSDTRLNCSAHLLNNILEHIFLMKENEVKRFRYLGATLTLVQSCKDLVAYFKRAALMEKLDTALEQTVPTRWNTHVAMLLSVSKNFQKIRDVSIYLLATSYWMVSRDNSMVLGSRYCQKISNID